MSKRMLITAGPTHEPIDDVRYIANRSSGRMGAALARSAFDAGWEVTLLLGPVTIEPPTGVRTVRFESTADLEGLLRRHFPDCDVLVMAAAVADYRPQRAAVAKMPRGAGNITIELTATPDLAAQCAAVKRADQRIVGFALEEPAALERRALEKMRRKGLDAIVANPLETMGATDVAARIFDSESQGGAAPLLIQGTKDEFARGLMEWIDARWSDIGRNAAGE